MSGVAIAAATSCRTSSQMMAANNRGERARVERQADGIIVTVGDTRLKLEVVAADVIHVTAAKDDSFFARKSIVAIPKTSAPSQSNWRAIPPRRDRGRRNVMDATERVPPADPSNQADRYTSEQGNWTLSTTRNVATLSTTKLKARVNLTTGAITFLDASGQAILVEKDRMLTPAEVQGEQTFHVRQQWQPNADESLYGLGQRQLGILDINGYDLDLWQHNTHVVVPFLVSSRGYGVLWDNTSFTRFGDLRPFEPIPAACLRDAQGKPGGLTAGTFTSADLDEFQNPRRLLKNGAGGPAPSKSGTDSEGIGGLGSHRRRSFGAQEASRAADRTVSQQPASSVTSNIVLTTSRGGARISTRWVGEIVPTATGDYQFQTYSNGGIKLWLDHRLVIDHWRQNWLADHDQVKIRLRAGRHYPIKIESGGDQATTMQLLWKTPAPAAEAKSISLWSEVGDGIDYYFVYGPELDKVVAGYRRITGQATMMPVWAFGLWQSRQRYETAQQLTDVLDGFRSRNIPFDNIVQDWQYWPRDKWGSHEFDPQRFPDPDGWIKTIHDKHARLMISVWGKYYPGTANFDAMQKNGFLYQPNLKEGLRDWIGFPYTFYDAFNPDARKLFWSQINSALFSKGVDAWWMDATEPDLTPSPPTLEGQRTYMRPTAMGTASRMMNAYALVNSKGVYDGQRSVAPDQRVFILTRSGFAGIQRYAAAVWSGDITSTWTAMAKQIPAGLCFSISGVPYWTMDIGGYTMSSKFSARNQTPEAAEEWRELNARWFQFGTFCPLLRVHGEQQPREMWTLGGENHPAYQTELKFDRLRYRLLPYIYSVAGEVTQNGGTMMRPLVMDFAQDKAARAVTDEYMFGPSFLVAPVTQYKARSRPLYLPRTDVRGWYDFWTGGWTRGGRTIDAPAPYDSMPLYVRAGSIIPFGPELQYTTEKPADPITLYVYTGADAAFTLYEDDGLTYGYERGQFARIPIRWNEARKTLTIGKREGSFPGMLKERTFEIVLVTKTHPYPLQGGESNGIGIPSHGGVAAAAVVRGRGRGGSVSGTMVRYRGHSVTAHLDTAK
jgi:alpha-D-xyloside xylohydrolase